MAQLTPYLGPTDDNLASIPLALKQRKQWVLWRGADRVDHRTGGVKLNKIPIQAGTLTPADSTDPLTWATFAECVAALPVALEEWEIDNPTAYRGGGLGYVFAEDDPYIGIDLDGCVDDVTGEVAPWAQQWLDRFHTYAEITPSTTGLHILLQGTLPPKGRRKGAIEMYSYARFFTMTGWQVESTPETIESCQAALAALWCNLFGAQVGEYVWTLDTNGTVCNVDKKPWCILAITTMPDGAPYARFAETSTAWPLLQCEVAVRVQTGGTPTIWDDDLLIQHMLQAQNGTKVRTLGQGTWAPDYGSQSEADLAFCILVAFWSRDAIQIDRIFRMTKLMRSKWDERRGGLTYGARTIAEALARQTEQYTSHALSTQTPPQGGKAQPWGTGFDFAQGVHVRDLMQMVRIPPRFLVDRLIPDGLTILAAPAKSYKSYFALSLALATVGQGDWCETFPVEQTGNVVFFGLEAPPMQLRNRLHQLCPNFDAAQCPHDLIFFSGMRCLPTFKNGLQHAIEQVIEHFQPRLVVIDPLSYLYRLGRQDDLASATLDLLWPLAEMAAQAKVALVAAEHLRKRSKEDVSVVDQLAGSHIKAAIVHALLMMRREGDDIIIETTLRDAGSQELALTLTFDPLGYEVTWGYKGANATLGATRRDSLRAQVYAELQDKRYPLKVLDFITNLDLPSTETTKSNLRQILQRAEKNGEVAVSRRGEYYWIGQ